jgi:hypothetical protein
MTTLNINIVTGLQMEGPNVSLTFCIDSNSNLCARFWQPFTEKVYTEIPVKHWTGATAAICTFLHLNGESKEQVKSKVQKIIHGIQNNLVTS